MTSGTVKGRLSFDEKFAADKSPAEVVAGLTDHERTHLFKGFTQDQWVRLKHDWKFWARPKQLRPPGDWSVWLLLAGRGFGKTRVGSEFVREEVESCTGERPKRGLLIAETAADARDVLVEGESGILATSPPWNQAKYEPSKRRVTWPCGCTATTFSGDEPDQLRGPQGDFAWVDELAKYKYPDDTWDNLEFALRLGENPRVVVSTTPRPLDIIKELATDSDTFVTTGSSYENYANLSPKFIKRVIKKYEGTRLGRQELLAEILTDVPGALWTQVLLNQTRVRSAPQLARIAVAVDPAVTHRKESNETGITGGGVGQGDGHLYLLHDESGQYSAEQWGRRAVELYDQLQADVMVGETNNGGELVKANVMSISRNVHFKEVNATRGKHVRSEPVASYYEQGRAHHVGTFAELEDQMLSMTAARYEGSGSPDRLDSWIWLVTELTEVNWDTASEEDWDDYKK